MIEIKEKSVTGKTIRLHDADNVVIARIDLALGTKLDGGFTCRGQVQAGHKVASRAIAEGLNSAVVEQMASRIVARSTHCIARLVDAR